MIQAFSWSRYLDNLTTYAETVGDEYAQDDLREDVRNLDEKRYIVPN